MLAYVNLAPDNGGIVLNVSEGGLGFQVVSAVQQLGAIPFWCSLAGNDRFEAVGELAWTDATRRTGGLRLTSAPPGVREQILNLAGLPPSPRPAPEVPMAQVHAVLPPTAPSASQSEKHVAPASDSIFRQITLLPETRVASAPRVTSSPVALARPVEKAVSTASRTRFPKFFRRAVTGLVILTAAGAAILLNGYRRQVGVSLMWLGERFAKMSVPQSVSPVSVRDSESSPAPESLSLTAKEPEKPLQSQIDETDRRSESESKRQETPILTRPQKSATPLSAKVPKPSQSVSAAATLSLPSSPMSGSTNSAPSTSTSSEAVGSSWFGSTHPLPDSSGSTGDLDVASASLAIYLEVGNFKDPLWATKATDTLSQSGFQAIVVRKGHLWMNSYHVLVGPFGTDADAETAQRSLESQGFKPRSTRIIPSKTQ